jgi:UDPglucose 6-dehydrogenase
MRVVVYGLWHLGCVTAACMADAGNDVVGLDLDKSLVDDLKQGKPPLDEPGLPELLLAGLRSGRLTFTTDAQAALHGAGVLWVTLDTPVDEQDYADVAFVRERLERVRGAVRPGTLVLISSQVPVGFTRALERDWAGLNVRFGVSPENLRLGKAIETFRTPERVVVGLSRPEQDRDLLTRLFHPFGQGGGGGGVGGTHPPRIEWMTLESAEMTKHALNAFLAVSVTFINELARLCEAVGANVKEVERGLKSEGRVGAKAYLGPGAAFAGGTLARDVRFLVDYGHAHGIPTPLFDGLWSSNEAHKDWTRQKVAQLLGDVREPTVAVLGLTYKAGTSTLRRSASVELCRWLGGRGARVRAHDPAVRELPDDLRPLIDLADSPAEALRGADLAVIATEWPAYKALRADEVVTAMRRPNVIDPNWFAAGSLANDPRVTYVATGRGGAAGGA